MACSAPIVTAAATSGSSCPTFGSGGRARGPVASRAAISAKPRSCSRCRSTTPRSVPLDVTRQAIPERRGEGLYRGPYAAAGSRGRDAMGPCQKGTGRRAHAGRASRRHQRLYQLLDRGLLHASGSRGRSRGAVAEQLGRTDTKIVLIRRLWLKEVSALLERPAADAMGSPDRALRRTRFGARARRSR